MDDKTDPFSLENLRLTPELSAELNAAAAKRAALKAGKARRSREVFVRITRAQSDRLDKVKTLSSGRLFRHLLFLDFASHGKPCTLANEALAGIGIDRRVKWRALRELEGLGLISVERRPRKSPRVTIIR